MAKGKAKPFSGRHRHIDEAKTEEGKHDQRQPISPLRVVPPNENAAMYLCHSATFSARRARVMQGIPVIRAHPTLVMCLLPADSRAGTLGREQSGRITAVRRCIVAAEQWIRR